MLRLKKRRVTGSSVTEIASTEVNIISGVATRFQFVGDGEKYSIKAEVFRILDEEEFLVPDNEWVAFSKKREGDEWGYPGFVEDRETWECTHYRIREFKAEAKCFTEDPIPEVPKRRGEKKITGDANVLYRQEWDEDTQKEGEWTLISRAGSAHTAQFHIDDLSWNNPFISETRQRAEWSYSLVKRWGIAFEDTPCPCGAELGRFTVEKTCAQESEDEDKIWLLSDVFTFGPQTSGLNYGLNLGQSAFIENLRVKSVQ
jgi:hypothetical protein